MELAGAVAQSALGAAAPVDMAELSIEALAKTWATCRLGASRSASGRLRTPARRRSSEVNSAPNKSGEPRCRARRPCGSYGVNKWRQ